MVIQIHKHEQGSEFQGAKEPEVQSRQEKGREGEIQRQAEVKKTNKQ